MAGALVLVIDDDAPIRVGMEEILHSWGCRTILADSAESALQQLGHNERTPDLIVADYRLREGKTGVQGIERINAHVGRRHTRDHRDRRHRADERDVVRRNEKSGYHLLHKPVSAANLRSLASYLLQKAQANADS